MKYDGYVPGVIWLQMIRGGIPQLVGTVSLTDWYDTAVRTLSYLLIFCHFVAACFVTTGRQDFREEVSYSYF